MLEGFSNPRQAKKLLQTISAYVIAVIVMGGISHDVVAQDKKPILITSALKLWIYIPGAGKIHGIADLQQQYMSEWKISYDVEGGGKDMKVRNCEQFLEARKFGLEPTQNVIRRGWSAVGGFCIAARILLDGAPSTISYLRGMWDGAVIAKSLPPELAHDELSKGSKSRNRSWVDAEPGLQLVKSETWRFSYTSEYGKHSITLLGAGDFNGDGIEDFLLRINHRPNSGSYFRSRIYVASRDSDRGMLRIIKSYSPIGEQP